MLAGGLFEVGEVEENEGTQQKGPVLRGGVTREDHTEVVRQESFRAARIHLRESAYLVLVPVPDLELDGLAGLHRTHGTQNTQLAGGTRQHVLHHFVVVQNLHLEVHARVGVTDLAQEGPLPLLGQEQRHRRSVEAQAGEFVLSLEEEGGHVVVALSLLVLVFHVHFEGTRVRSQALFR